MVSGLGKASVAAIGVTNQPKYFVFTFFYAINSGISLLIARRVGEKRQREANVTFLSGLSVIIAANILLTLLCLVFAEPYMRLCGANSETIALSVMYFRIVIGFSIFSVISLYINAAQRGSGNTRIAITTNLTSNAVNVVMNYLLIGGHLGFPALGVKGAAIATVLGTVVACIMSIRSLFNKNSFVYLPYIRQEKPRPDPSSAKELGPICGTILGENLLSRVGFMVVGAMTARIGTNPKAEKYSWSAQKFGLMISIAFSVLMAVYYNRIFDMYFPDDPEMIGYGRIIATFFAVIMPIQVSKIVFNGTLRGAGDVRFTLIGSTIGITIVQPIVLWVLTQKMDLGLTGVWISILISQGVQWILFGTRFLSGKWKENVV